MKSKTNLLRLICVIVAVVMALSVFAGCSGKKEESAKETKTETTAQAETKEQTKEEPLLEYTVYLGTDSPPDWLDNPNDVITPYVEKKFNIKVKQVLYNQGLSFRERLNTFIAADNLPDVVYGINQDAVMAAGSGRFAETGSLIKEHMPELLKYCPESDWGSALYNGRMYSIPNIWINTAAEEYKDDLYAAPPQNWSYWTRESILRELGYKFTPLSEIQKKINETQTKPTMEDFAVEPAIATPDDFYSYLKKIKDLNRKVGDRNMIPLSIPHALQIHLGNMFAVTNAWQFNDQTKDVAGWLGSEYAKDWYKFLNKLYKEGLLDKDFSIQQPDQLQEKAVAGVLACGMWVPDIIAADKALKVLDPTDAIRPMRMPLKPGAPKFGIDGVSPVTFQWFINKDYKDIPRLMRYFDWFYSDEGIDLINWGPEELGLWEMKDGKKVFKDDALYQSIKKGDHFKDKGTPAYDMYYSKGLLSRSVAFNCAPTRTYSKAMWQRSYPFHVGDMYSYANGFMTSENLDWKGRIVQGKEEVSNAASSWWWTEFTQGKSPKLFAARTDEEFEKNWNELYKEFLEKGKYEEGKKIMIQDFLLRGFGR